MTKGAVRSDWAGRIVDERFTLLEWLGGSEWSGVYLTELQGPRSQKAAIKLVPADTGDEEAYITGGAGTTTTLPHPHMVHLFHTGRCQIDANGLLYTVTEYAEEALSEIVPERPLTPREANEMLVPVLDALSYLHGKGFVHGHLKPSNIMAVGNQVKLSADRVEIAGEFGTHFPALTVYDAPEVATGTISPAADVWSLGITLVEALTQHPPVWDRSTDSEPTLSESIPQPFADIARECLRFDPARRCTLSEIKAHLEPARSFPDAAGKTGRTVPAKFRMTALIVAVLVLLAVIVVVQSRSHHTPPSVATVKQQPVTTTAALPSQAPVPGTQTSKGVVVKGAVAERVLPNVPRSASRTIQGKIDVRIQVTVDPNGVVTNATFDSPGVSKYFAKLSLQAARNWRFTPPQIDDRAISSVWTLRFRFRRTGTEVTPVEASP